MQAKLALSFVLFCSAAIVTADDTVLRQVEPVFTAGRLPDGTAQIWTFRNRADNGIARVVIDSQGFDYGATPDGYAELMVRSQDEVHGPSQNVLSSSDVQGRFRVMSHSFGFTNDRTRGECRGTQCPDTVEVHSSKNLRLTADNKGVVDLVTGNESRLGVNRRGKGEIDVPSLRAKARRQNFVCVDDQGVLVSQWLPCTF